MEPVEKEVLNDARVYLQAQVHLIPPFIQLLRDNNILEDFDCQRITSEVSEDQKHRIFLNILVCKDGMFGRFLDFLRENEYTHVAADLEKRKQDTLKLYDKLSSQLHHWLTGNYSYVEGRQIEVAAIVDRVNSELCPGLSNDCITTLLIHIVTQVFPSASLDETNNQRVIIINLSPDEAQSEEMKNNPTTQAAQHIDTDPAVGLLSATASTAMPSYTDASVRSRDSSWGLPCKPLDLRSDDFNPCLQQQIHAGGATYSNKVMQLWTTDEVCAWLTTTIPDLSPAEIEPFRKAKLKGGGLMKLTEEKMKQHFPALAIGDIWEILEKRDHHLNDQHALDNPIGHYVPPRSNNPVERPLFEIRDPDRCSRPESDDPTVHLENIYHLNSSSIQSGKHPVRCTSPTLSSNQPQSQAGDERQDSRETPLQATERQEPRETPLPVTDRQEPRETPLQATERQDSRETPLKATERQDSRETPLKTTERQDSRATPLKATERQDSRETPLTATERQDRRETPLTATERQDSRETPLKALDRQDSRETPLKRPKKEDSNETPLKGPKKQDSNETQFKGPKKQDPKTTAVKVQKNLKSREPLQPERQDSGISQCRLFSTDAMNCTVYRKGNILSCKEGVVEEGRIKTLNMFVDQESLNSKRERFSIVAQVVPFFCACLNERYNGTIYFGVASKNVNQRNESGIIKGAQLPEDKWKELETHFEKGVLQYFAADQQDLVSRCMHKLQRIPVETAQESGTEPTLFVIEADIAPSSQLCEDDAFRVKVPIFRKGKITFAPEDVGKLFRCFDGIVRPCTTDEESIYMRNKDRIAKDRKTKEENQKALKEQELRKDEDLNMRLRDLLCKGDENFPVDNYPILVVNRPPHEMSQSDMEKELSFLSRIPFKAAFDLDDNATLTEYLEDSEKLLIKIIESTDAFKSGSSKTDEPDRLQKLQEDIKHSAIPSWIFVNGLRGNKKDHLTWNRENKKGFKEAVRFFHQEIPTDRALVVFLLLSEDHDVMLEVADELMSSFQDQWLFICESPEIAHTWSSELIRRNCIDEKIWKENSIIGMPLSQICETVKRLHGPMQPFTEPTVVTKAGARIPLDIHVTLHDLEVISADECENYAVPLPMKTRNLKEEEFYKGSPVSWWNFWCDHVLRRTQLDKLNTLLDKALQGRLNDDDHVSTVTLYHEAGAGGTTLAMHALWEHRTSHRCAVVNSISDPADTADQILKLHRYEERGHPKPVLILLDNLEAEKTNMLFMELGERTKQMSRLEQGVNPEVSCVLLYCCRKNELASDNKNQRVLLKHQLDEREIAWFQTKYERMEKNHKEGLSGDPALLISFNIMKENFDTTFIRKMVTRLLLDVKDRNERKLLKFVALLNAYDLQRRAIPRVAFDTMMTVWQSGLRFGPKAFHNRWEVQISAATKNLLNVTDQVSLGKTKAIKIVSPLMAHHILEEIQQQDEPHNQSLSDMVMDLFHTNDLFAHSSPSAYMGTLLNIIRDVLKSRIRNERGVPASKFAQIIEDIISREDASRAIEVMEEGFQLTQDPFVAQQVARLYIHTLNWEKAKEYAKKATEMRSDNSFLFDTLGRVYLDELKEKLSSINKTLTPMECLPHIKCAFKGLEIFRRVQTLSQTADYSHDNESGYFGELDIIVTLLDCLSSADVFSRSGSLKRFLVEQSFEIEEMNSLNEHIKDVCFELKSFSKRSKGTIKKLEDEYIQLREQESIDGSRRSANASQLKPIKDRLSKYFGEETDEAPQDLSDEEQCKYRRRRVSQLRASSMLSIFDMRNEDDGKTQLLQIQSIISKNVDTGYEDAEDLQTLMCVNLALMQLSHDFVTDLMFEEMVAMSRRLYAKRGKREVSFSHLEPYLFYVMFNWSQLINARKIGKPIMHHELEDALRNWKEAYYEKYPRQKVGEYETRFRKKETTIFFFAKGIGMNSITSYKLLRELTKTKTVSFWTHPEIKEQLERFDGILQTEGNEVEIKLAYPNGNHHKLKIATSVHVSDRTLYHKKINFIIGFSWKGPIAFDVLPQHAKTQRQAPVSDPNETPQEASAYPLSPPPSPHPPSSHSPSQHRPSQHRPSQHRRSQHQPSQHRSSQLPSSPRPQSQHPSSPCPPRIDRMKADYQRKVNKIDQDLQEIEALKMKKDQALPLSPIDNSTLRTEYDLQCQRKCLMDQLSKMKPSSKQK